MSEPSCERPMTPPTPQSLRRILTPKTPERLPRSSIHTASPPSSSVCTDGELDWEKFTLGHIDSLSEEGAKDALKSAMRRLRSLDTLNRENTVLASHYRFNYQMLLSEQEERAKRQEVDDRLACSTQELLRHKLDRTADEERTFRTRHLKAKKRVAELVEDTKRQQHSIDHLRQALSAHSSFHSPLQRSVVGGPHHGEGGLDVLSDAAGLARMRELDRADKDEESPRAQSGPLLSPAAFQPELSPRQTGLSSAKKRPARDELRGGDDAEQSSGSERPPPGRRLTFNSGGHLPSRHYRSVPLTPKSPRRQLPKLEPSALS